MADNPKSFTDYGHSSRELRDRNPSPPKELLENEEATADLISGTVVTKQWVLKTLLSAVKVVETDKPDNESDGVIELDEKVESEMCTLWDMSMDNAVANFLLECDIPATLFGIIVKSRALRLTEISVGILANLTCNPPICKTISEIDDFITISLHLLESHDPPILVETIRLLTTCISTRPTNDNWLKKIKTSDFVLPSFVFILKSSTNNNLLEALAQLLDNLLDSDEEILTKWAQTEFVAAITEAMKQISNSKPEAIDTFCHILQLISVSPHGCVIINQHGNAILKQMERYLKDICEQDFIDVNGRQCGLASCIDVLEKIYLSPEICCEGITNSAVLGYLLQLSRSIIPIPTELGDGISDLNKVLIETLSNFWCQLIRYWSKTTLLLEALDKTPEKDLTPLLINLKHRTEFEYINHLKELIDKSGGYNRLTELINNEVNR